MSTIIGELESCSFRLAQTSVKLNTHNGFKQFFSSNENYLIRINKLSIHNKGDSRANGYGYNDEFTSYFFLIKTRLWRLLLLITVLP